MGVGVSQDWNHFGAFFRRGKRWAQYKLDLRARSRKVPFFVDCLLAYHTFSLVRLDSFRAAFDLRRGDDMKTKGMAQGRGEQHDDSHQHRLGIAHRHRTKEPRRGRSRTPEGCVPIFLILFFSASQYGCKRTWQPALLVLSVPPLLNSLPKKEACRCKCALQREHKRKEGQKGLCFQ